MMMRMMRMTRVMKDPPRPPDMIRRLRRGVLAR